MINRKWLRKVASVVLGTMLIGTMLTGCGNEEAKESSKESVSSEVKEETKEVSEESISEEAEGPDISEPYTIDMFMSTWGATTDDIELVQEAMSEITREKINADVVLHCIDINQWGTQIPLEFTAQTKIDYIVTAINMGSGYVSMATSNQLYPLSDLLDEYGQGIKEVLGDFTYGAAISGDVYGVPVNKELCTTYATYFFNKAMVEQLGLEEEVKNVKSYKDLEPLFEIAAAEIPDVTCLSFLRTSAVTYSVNPYVESFFNGAGFARDGSDYQMVDYYEDERVVEALSWTHDMYKKGYISEAVTVNDDNSIKNGTAFCFAGNGLVGAEEALKAEFGYEVIAVDTLAPYTIANQALGVMGSIGSTTENPERTMMFMNLLYTDPELLNTLIYGVEGVHYKKTEVKKDSEGNDVQFIDYADGVDANTVGWANQGWAYGNQFLDYLREGQSVDTWLNYRKTNESAEVSPLLGFVFDKSSVSTESTALSAVYTKYELLFKGVLDPKEALPELMAEYKAAGYDKVKDELQRQVDAWVAANK